MKALVLRDDADTAAHDAQILMDQGFHVLCVETLHTATAMARSNHFDLLIVDERIAGQLTHALALLAEQRAPAVSTILVTDRPAEETDELFDLIPSTYALIGRDAQPQFMQQLVASAVAGYAAVAARVRRGAEADAAEAALEDDPVFEAAIAAEGGTTDTPDSGPAPDAPLDIPTYEDAVRSVPELAEPDLDDDAVAFSARSEFRPFRAPRVMAPAVTTETIHLAQLHVIEQMRSARASFR